MLDRAQANGRRLVRYRVVLEDNESDQHEFALPPKSVLGDFDAEAYKTTAGDNLLTSQLATEDGSFASRFAADDNSLTWVLNPKWSTGKRIAKKLIRWMMRERDPRIVIWLEPLINYLDANYTPTQLANFLDITIPQLQKMDAKIQAILNAPAVSASVKVQLAIADTNSEEIE